MSKPFASCKTIVRTPDGRAFLHVWRNGPVYEAQKGPVFRDVCNNVKLTRLPHGSTPPVLHLRIGRPLPFSAASFDVAYLYHVLEHHTPSEQARFLAEVYRVLKPSASLRISSPDLEQKARGYLARLEACRQNPSPTNALWYRWATYMLFDQMVRTRPGGEMVKAIHAGELDEAMMRDLFGDSMDYLWRPDLYPKKRLHGPSLSEGLMGLVRALLVRIRGKDPRFTGECDLWHDDFFSLALTLEAAGFHNVVQVDFNRSAIPGWDALDLDRSTHGDYPLEPSLYVECRRP